MVWIATGFGAIFVLSYWLSARVGMASQSALGGLLAGLVSLVVLLGVYIYGLALLARARLQAFVETYLPQLVEQLLLMLPGLAPLKEAI